MNFSSLSQKVLFMGLGASGKTSIRSVVFEGKSPRDILEYKATINYYRTSKSIIDSTFQILDCGGQESFISVFVGEQAEFIFSNVNILVWVVDTSDFDQVSTSKFYFDHAVTRLSEYSPGAVIFCLLHKIDLVLPDLRSQILETMNQYFVPKSGFEIHYRTTSIFDTSIFFAFGDIVQTLLLQSTKAKTVSDALQEYIDKHQELSGIAIYTYDGLPIFEEGFDTEKIIILANLWLSNHDRIRGEFKTEAVFKTVLETDDYMFVFQKMKERLLLTGVAKKVAPLQFVLIKMEQLADIVVNLL
ncbi:MAG: ADP-ribosylation factor-like protein [Candidatus Hodarchaeales archaeon]